jgi:Zn finger protein HypA/HybF involved in hydrogenase expression
MMVTKSLVEVIVENRHLSRDERARLFVVEAREQHGARYGYDQAGRDFVNWKNKVPIFCRRHQRMFEQTPHEHVRGQGCPDCGGRRGATLDARAATFIAKARAVHADRYRYDKASFSRSADPVRVECPEHGWFTQRATNHLQGQGCPSCPRLGRMPGKGHR